MTAANILSCPKCRKSLPPESVHGNDTDLCPSCRSKVMVIPFPALLNSPVPVRTGMTVASDSDATCYYHTQKQAQTPCDACGRFICDLCAIEMRGETLCPSCLASGQKKNKMSHLETQRTLYDSLALMLSVLPWALLIFWVFTIITAPMALFLAIRHWNTPSSIIPRSKLRLVLTIIFSIIQILVWAYFIIF